MDYSNAANTAMQGGPGRPANPGKPLESIALATNRVNSANVLIGQFIDRFHGDSPGPIAAEKDGPEERRPYNNEIGRLFDAIDRLEARVEALNAIG